MKIRNKIVVALALLTSILMLSVQAALAAPVASKPLLGGSPGGYCEFYGGSWDGVDIFDLNGECTYPPGSAGHADGGSCNEHQNYITVPPVGSGPTRCENIPPAYGKGGGEAGKTDDPATITTSSDVMVTFDAGACAGKCTVSPRVLGAAGKALSELDGEVLGEAYVKIRNPEGGSYKICMPGEGTIYQWISGEWRAIPTSTAGGQSCAYGSGDGQFVLVN